MQKHKEWLDFAEQDLKVAKIIISSPEAMVGPILFHAQQCAEKAFKAFLVYRHQPLRKTHDLISLIKLCLDIDPEFNTLIQEALDLNPYISGSRYPDSHFAIPDLTTATASIQKAEKILRFTIYKIDLESSRS
jgi:HEPN domain-containing protein